VRDPAKAGARLAARYGLFSQEGGRHPGWGTSNRIIPLGAGVYLELVGVVDAREAARSPFGRWVTAMTGAEPRPFGWAVRSPDIDVTARHLGLRVVEGSRQRPDGTILRWRVAGVDEAQREPALPFFLDWDAGSEHPGTLAPGLDAVAVTELHLRGDSGRIGEWLGSHDMPLTIQRGAPAVTRVVLDGPDGHIVLR
jgi:hypothetical protein